MFKLLIFATLISATVVSQNKVTSEKVKINSTNKSTDNGNSSAYDWIKENSKKNSPTTWNLLEQYRLLPQKIEYKLSNGTTYSGQKAISTYHFLNGSTKIEQLSSMSTNVHEVAHAFFSHNALAYSKKNNRPTVYTNAEGYFYVSPTEMFFVSFPTQRLFPSKDLASVIPKSKRTLRFNTYITGNTSTQDQGVVGLLNEFNAYYIGALYTYDMLPSYLSASKSMGKGLQTWVQYSQSLMDAYYEFNYFITTYFEYMSKNHPKSYAQLKSYKPFWDAYNTINKEYKELNILYQQTIKAQVLAINAKKSEKLIIESNTLWLDSGNGKRTGVSLKLKAKAVLVNN